MQAGLASEHAPMVVDSDETSKDKERTSESFSDGEELNVKFSSLTRAAIQDSVHLLR